jgi:hypothetical protein
VEGGFPEGAAADERQIDEAGTLGWVMLLMPGGELRGREWIENEDGWMDG